MSEARTKFIKIRATQDEIAEFKKRAGSDDVSSYIRKVILDQPLPRKTQAPKKIIHTVDPDLIREVNRIGNNINQIAKQLNTGSELSNKVLITLLNIQNSLDQTVQRVMTNDS